MSEAEAVSGRSRLYKDTIKAGVFVAVKFSNVFTNPPLRFFWINRSTMLNAFNIILIIIIIKYY